MKKNITRKLAATMAVGMSVITLLSGIAPIYAATVTGVSGEQADIQDLVATITATGITVDGAEVKAYQLVDGYYDNNNLIRYVLTDETNAHIADIENPTVDEIIAIANNIGANKFEGQVIEMEEDTTSGDYTADVEPGLYLILVSKQGTDTVFNPAVVAVNVNDANAVAAGKITSGTVDLNSAFSVKGTAAYIKSSKSDLDKQIVDSTGADIGYGDAVAVGDEIYFKLDNMTIPSFSGDYEDPVYKISDKLEAGKFAAIEDLVVKVNGTVLPATETKTDGNGQPIDVTNYTLTQATNTEFVIEFSEEYLRAHAADATRPAVEVTYKTSLLAAAGMNFAENHNSAKVEYSNDPTDSTSVKVIDDKNTYHYTFAINGLVDGEADATEDGMSDIMNKIEYVKDANGDPVRTELAGATFAISKAEDMSNPLKTAVSDDKGRFLFDGLDVGTYYIKETAAPLGYALNDNIYKVVIEATMDSATGIMTEYKITTSVKKVNSTEWVEAKEAKFTNTVAADAVADDGSVTNNIAKTQETTDVVNSKIWQLPSSGGAGITVALGVSAVLAMTAGGLVVTAKRKSRQ